MCMEGAVCQECLLPAIFHCAETRTNRDATLSFLSWLGCNTRVSGSSFAQMWSTSLHIKHQKPSNGAWMVYYHRARKHHPWVDVPPPRQKIKIKKNIKTQNGAVMECTSSFKPLQHIFSSPSLWILFSFPNGLKRNQRHTPATLTLDVQHTLALRCHRMSHSHLITSRKLHAHTSRFAD